jgi:hypothetical protein
VFLMFALVAIVVMACQIEARTLRGIDIERTTATCAKWGKHKAAAGTNGDATVSNAWLPFRTPGFSFICATSRLRNASMAFQPHKTYITTQEGESFSQRQV